MHRLSAANEQNATLTKKSLQNYDFLITIVSCIVLKITDLALMLYH